ncbi:MAG: Glu/Leu/Phe/Val dehydrogenase dimerization domain-containing protein [Chlamydiota bacterium]
MATIEKIYEHEHEEILFFYEPTCNLKVIIGIHNTVLGPALGGTRLWPYSTVDDALQDVLRLSRGMTYKASLAGLDFGGGKAVLLGNPDEVKTEAYFRAYGQFVESLQGRYITAEDVNTNVTDMEHIFTETNYVVGVEEIHGGSGNPASYTALGVYKGVEAACQKVYGEQSLSGKVVALQGVGEVGSRLGVLLSNAGAKIVFSEINADRAVSFKNKVAAAEQVEADEVYEVPCDIFSPCGLGAIINNDTVEKLNCQIIAGAANNQLKEDFHGQILKERGILYAPDYLINAGGLLNVSVEFEGWTPEKSRRLIDPIYERALKAFDISEKENLSVNKVADYLAEQRIKDIMGIKKRLSSRQISYPLPRRKQR